MTTDPKAAELEGVVAMAALVDYQPGAVVSRTLVKKSAGTVTAFAFDAGEGLSEVDNPNVSFDIPNHMLWAARFGHPPVGASQGGHAGEEAHLRWTETVHAQVL